MDIYEDVSNLMHQDFDEAELRGMVEECDERVDYLAESIHASKRKRSSSLNYDLEARISLTVREQDVWVALREYYRDRLLGILDTK